MESYGLEGRSTLIVGATGGIGAATARSMAKAGARLVLAGRSLQRLSSLADEIADLGGVVMDAMQLDVADPASIDSVTASARHALGGIEVLVVASGISPVFKRAEDVARADWDQIIEVNARGPFLIAQEVGSMMLDHGGSIVFLSSVHGTSAAARLLPYAASKGALEMVMRTLALEWAPRGVRVNSVAPGYVDTELTQGIQANPRLSAAVQSRTPLKRFAHPDEVASAITFLASDAASYITGTTLFVDGGWTAQ